MDIYEVITPEKLNKEKLITVKVPGSKSITNRALLLAALRDGETKLNGCLRSDDADYFLECIKTLGFEVAAHNDTDFTIKGMGGSIPNKKAEIYVGSAGTAARFLVCFLALSEGEYVVNASEQMKKRPMLPLFNALKDMGARIEYLENEGFLPVRIVGNSDESSYPDSVSVDITKSSQFLSALLIVLNSKAKKPEIKLIGTHGMAYVVMTDAMIEDFNMASAESFVYDIEPDMSAAAYFYAIAAITGCRVSVDGVVDNMLQGDIKLIDVLTDMGCTKSYNGKSIVLKGPKDGKLKGVTVDMSAFSDQALTLANAAPYATTPTTITGIGHIKFQECDRMNAIVTNLKALGIKTDCTEDSITIYPGEVSGATLETYEDHRVAMACAINGLRVKGIKLLNPKCVGKTFKNYFEVLEELLRAIAC